MVVLSIILILLGIETIDNMCIGAEEPGFYVNENYNSYSVGHMPPESENHVGHMKYTGKHEITVEDNEGTDLILSILTASTSQTESNISASMTPSAKGKVIMEFDLKLLDANSSAIVYLQPDGDSNQYPLMRCTTEGIIQAMNAGAYEDTDVVYVLNTIVRIKWILDTDSGLYELYIDNTLEKSGVSPTGDSGIWSNGISRVHFNVISSQPSRIFIDNIKLYKGICSFIEDDYYNHPVNQHPTISQSGHGNITYTGQMPITVVSENEEKRLNVSVTANNERKEFNLYQNLFPSVKSTVIEEFDIKLSDQACNRILYASLPNITMPDDPDNLYPIMRFGTNQNIQVYDSESYSDVQTYQFNTWYKIKLITDPQTGLWDLYINGVLKRDDFTPTSNSTIWEKGISKFKFNIVTWYTTAVYLDNVKCYPEVIGGNYQVDPLVYSVQKRTLNSYQGIHPRILTDSSGIHTLQQVKSTTHAPIWNQLKEKADQLASSMPPQYYEDPSIPDNGWMRTNGDAMALLAMSYILTEDTDYLNAAKNWAVTTCGYPVWGDHNDALSAAHILTGLGILYDWCYSSLDASTKDIIRNTIIERAPAMAARLLKGGDQYGYDDNHIITESCGLATAALAIFDEYNPAETWIDITANQFDKYIQLVGDDGATHEGLGYWGYSLQSSIMYGEMAEKLLGINIFAAEWYKNACYFRLYSTVPTGSWGAGNKFLSFNDADRGDLNGPDHMLRALAHRYNDGYAQWLADRLFEAGLQNNTYMYNFLNMLWYDPAIQATAPNSLPTIKNFDNAGYILSRSAWYGNESVLAFSCGPVGGKKLHEQLGIFSDYIKSSGHAHPDANHFILYGNGEWLIRDDGYVSKHTQQHNTLLINGQGQIGDGDVFLDTSKYFQSTEMATSYIGSFNANMDHIIGDATAAYEQGLGLQKYMRHLLYIKPDVLIVIDDIQVDAAKDLELRLFPEQQSATLQSDGSYLLQGASAKLRFTQLTPQDTTVTTQMVPVFDRDNTTYRNKLAFQVQKQSGITWKNAMALSWSDTSHTPETVKLWYQGNNVWAFMVKGELVFFFWTT